MSNLQEFILTFGYIGIFITIFAESGFLLGFFLPGDSLLFTLGLLSSMHIFNFWILVPLTIIAAVLGDTFGYYLGQTFGPRIFSRDDSWLFKKRYVHETEEFYKKHGKKAIVLARFIPLVRTFIPIFAGIGTMNYRVFLFYNIIGGIIWAGGFLTVAYILGKRFPGIEHYLVYIIAGIVIVSVLPVARELLKRYRRKQ